MSGMSLHAATLASSAAACLVFCACCLFSPSTWAADPVSVQVAQPARGNVIRYVTLPGSLKANQQATLYAKVPGYLKSLTVDKGDKVSAGQALGEIEVPELEADLARCRAELSVAEIELRRVSQAQAQAPDLVVPQTVDDARGKVEIARANLERLETLLRYAHMTAPFDGVVTARFVDPGAFIPAATSGSAASSAAVVTLMDFNTVRVQVPVPELEAALVKVGQPVNFTVDVLKGQSFAARVSRLSYAIDRASQTMLVEADVPNLDLALRPGMFVTARVGVEEHTDVLTVPVGALLVEKAITSVFVAESGRAKKVAVKVGFNDGAKVEIVSGLTGGESVILLGKAPLTDGAAIMVMEAK
jgi:membrane fusion protein (multidrug efflux system)